jgi:hypothetical protein
MDKSTILMSKTKGVFFNQLLGDKNLIKTRGSKLLNVIISVGTGEFAARKKVLLLAQLRSVYTIVSQSIRLGGARNPSGGLVKEQSKRQSESGGRSSMVIDDGQTGF